MYYEEDFVEEVRQRSDVVDIISSYVNLKRTGSNYVGLCPFHNEKTASFSVSPSKQMYYCFGCGAGGNVFTFLMEYENLTFVEALERLAEQAGMVLPEKGNSENAVSIERGPLVYALKMEENWEKKEFKDSLSFIPIRICFICSAS